MRASAFRTPGSFVHDEHALVGAAQDLWLTRLRLIHLLDTWSRSQIDLHVEELTELLTR
jgi:hypothetical protein